VRSRCGDGPRPQGVDEIVRAAEPVCRGLRRGLGYRRVDAFGYGVSYDPQLRRPLSEKLGDHRLGGTPGDRRLAGEHLVQHSGEGIDIAARVQQPVAGGLLRTHVLRSTEVETRFRQPIAPGFRHRERDAEVRHHRLALVQQDVLRLDVAVDDVMAMGVAQGVSDLAGDGQCIVERELSLAGKPSTQRLAVHVRHGVIEGAASLTAVVQRHDMGMVQAGGDGNLTQESLGTECGGDLGVQDLERDGTIVLQVPGEEHGPCPPAPDVAVDPVAVGQRLLEAVQRLGDQTAPERCPAYIGAMAAQQLEEPTDPFAGQCVVGSVVGFVLLRVVLVAPRHDTDAQNIG
jgi:hypothetical protein